MIFFQFVYSVNVQINVNTLLNVSYKFRRKIYADTRSLTIFSEEFSEDVPT